MFWLTITAMMIIALAIILLPLLRKSSLKSENRSQQNISIAQEKLKQLKRAHQEGTVDDNGYKSARNELEQILHSDLGSDNGSAMETVERLPYKTGVALTIMLPCVVLALYFSIGSPDSIARQIEPAPTSYAQKERNTPVLSDQSGQVGDVRTMFERLKQKLAANPKNGQGWMMMGLTYTHFKRYSEAVEAYQKAVKLLPGNQEASDALNRAMAAMTNNVKEVTADKIERKMQGPDGQIVDVGAMVTRLRTRLDANPDNLPGWIMLGRSYMSLGRYNDAVYAYQNALSIKTSDAEVIVLLQSALNARKTGIKP